MQGGESYDRRRKRQAVFGLEELAVWSNTRSAIQYFSSVYEVLQFTGTFHEVDPCASLSGTSTSTTPNPTNGVCATGLQAQTIGRSYGRNDTFTNDFLGEASAQISPIDSAEVGFFQRQLDFSSAGYCPCSYVGNVVDSSGAVFSGAMNGYCSPLNQVSIQMLQMNRVDKRKDVFLHDHEPAIHKWKMKKKSAFRWTWHIIMMHDFSEYCLTKPNFFEVSLVQSTICKFYFPVQIVFI